MGWDAGKAHLLDGPEREHDMPAEKVAELLTLTGGETVIDYGAGTGRLTLAVAERLGPEGSVIAIEDSSDMFGLLSQRLTDIPRAVPMLIAPEGLLLLIDWEHGNPREDGPPEDVLLTAAEAIQELAVAGLLARRVDAPFADRYTLLATAKPSLGE